MGLEVHTCEKRSSMAVAVRTVLGSHFGLVGEVTTHVRTYSSGDWDVHWGDLDFDPWPYPHRLKSEVGGVHQCTPYFVGRLDRLGEQQKPNPISGGGIQHEPIRSKLRLRSPRVAFKGINHSQFVKYFLRGFLLQTFFSSFFLGLSQNRWFSFWLPFKSTPKPYPQHRDTPYWQQCAPIRLPVVFVWYSLSTLL